MPPVAAAGTVHWVAGKGMGSHSAWMGGYNLLRHMMADSDNRGTFVNSQRNRFTQSARTNDTMMVVEEKSHNFQRIVV